METVQKNKVAIMTGISGNGRATALAFIRSQSCCVDWQENTRNEPHQTGGGSPILLNAMSQKCRCKSMVEKPLLRAIGLCFQQCGIEGILLPRLFRGELG
jgi:hypothetical protein